MQQGGLDIHRLIGAVPHPEAGWTPPGYHYLGPYNPLDKQLRYDEETGEILEWYQKPGNSADAVAALHDVCYDRAEKGYTDKHQCDRQMVKHLEALPFKDKGVIGSLAQRVIKLKEKLGLGLYDGGQSFLI